MPYIKTEERQIFNTSLSIASANIETPGQLNYVISKLLTGYLDKHGTNYAHFNDCIGALEAAKLEFYRRAAAPYEDIKMRENGDI